MITNFLISTALGIVTGLASLLPSWSVDTSAVTGASSNVGYILTGFNSYLPETMVVTCLGILLAVKLALFTWRVILAVYRLIPFNG